MIYASGDDLERRRVMANVLAREHGMPLAFHDSVDQYDFDRKAQAVLAELDLVASDETQLRPKEGNDGTDA